jgi:hypothetical protein
MLGQGSGLFLYHTPLPHAYLVVNGVRIERTQLKNCVYDYMSMLARQVGQKVQPVTQVWYIEAEMRRTVLVPNMRSAGSMPLTLTSTMGCFLVLQQQGECRWRHRIVRFCLRK